ncbi:MAG: type II secretion system F family protein, partial [Microbacterium sp.]|nr:type II secretion system F family protein [Microbacterium sp.]
TAIIWVPTLIVVIIGFSIWWRANKNKDSIRSKIDPIKLKIPAFGTLNTKIAIARFARNFAQMMGAGVPVLRSLQIVGETSGNWVIEQAMDRIADSVRMGGNISTPLMREPVFPSMVTQMIAVGENSGALETMLHKVADFYDEQVEEETKALASTIEPIMTSLLGVVVGFMVIALYMPMFNLMGEIGG